MLPPKLNDSLLNVNYFNPFKSMNSNNKVSEPSEATKILNRGAPALSNNVTLLIELGIVIIVILVVGLVFYLSHRKSKKRNNRRRWMQSDLSIDNSNDGQIHDTTLEEGEHRRSVHRGNQRGGHQVQIYDPSLGDRTINVDRDDYPPPYESVVQQTRKKGRQSAKRFKNCKNNLKRLDRNLPDCHNANRNEEALLSAELYTCISTICNENSSLIENPQSASTSSPDIACKDGDRECAMRENCLSADIKENNHKLQKEQLARTDGETETDEKLNTVPTKTVGRENAIAVLDASGLPTYDTALKIQECGNM